jgi:hypothetical protein
MKKVDWDILANKLFDARVIYINKYLQKLIEKFILNKRLSKKNIDWLREELIGEEGFKVIEQYKKEFNES